jgi:hypothetical protein
LQPQLCLSVRPYYISPSDFNHVTNPHTTTHNHTRKIIAAGEKPALISLIGVVKYSWLLSAALTALMSVSYHVLRMMFPTNVTTTIPFYLLDQFLIIISSNHSLQPQHSVRPSVRTIYPFLIFLHVLISALIHKCKYVRT